MERAHEQNARAMGTMNQRGSLGHQRKAQISNHKKIQTSKLQTLIGRFMERFHVKIGRATGIMNRESTSLHRCAPMRRSSEMHADKGWDEG